MIFFGLINLLAGALQIFISLGLTFKVLPGLAPIYKDLSVDASANFQWAVFFSFANLIWGVLTLLFGAGLIKNRKSRFLRIIAPLNILLIALVVSYLYQQMINAYSLTRNF